MEHAEDLIKKKKKKIIIIIIIIIILIIIIISCKIKQIVNYNEMIGMDNTLENKEIVKTTMLI
jgi:flagellar basal body-associated protein FliL